MNNEAAINNHQPDNAYQCHHIFPDDHRCGSPRMRDEQFCYYHHDSRRPVVRPHQRLARRSTFSLFTPTDFGAIQESLGELLIRIAANDIDPRRAGLLLYCLQIASTNLRSTRKEEPSAPAAQPALTETQPCPSAELSPSLEETVPCHQNLQPTPTPSPTSDRVSPSSPSSSMKDSAHGPTGDASRSAAAMDQPDNGWQSSTQKTGRRDGIDLRYIDQLRSPNHEVHQLDLLENNPGPGRNYFRGATKQ